MVLFLSHAAGDVKLAEFLEASFTAFLPGLTVFRASRPDQIPPGREWFQHVVSGLRTADAYLVLLTPRSQNRPWVIFETGAAWFADRKLILALAGGLDASEVIEPLRHLQLLSLEKEQEANVIVNRLGGVMSDVSVFVQSVRSRAEIDHVADVQSRSSEIEVDGVRFAWAGESILLPEGDARPVSVSIREPLTKKDMRLSTIRPNALQESAADHWRPLYLIENGKSKHKLIHVGGDISVVRPDWQPDPGAGLMSFGFGTAALSVLASICVGLFARGRYGLLLIGVLGIALGVLSFFIGHKINRTATNDPEKPRETSA
ncbi:MAG: toll/interleukin-1 receptor domain-containing protein [Gemmatimonadota bacterium]